MKGIRLVAAVAIMLLVLGSGIALAEQNEASDVNPALSAPPAPNPGPEVAANRTATSQTFQLPDGARETRIFANPINYETPSGTWKPIDESLEEGGGSTITNGENSFDLSLPKELDEGPVRITTAEGWVASELLGTATNAVEVEGSSADYESSRPGLDFELASLSNGLKEDIELANASQPSRFTFHLSASSELTPVLQEDGSIDFQNEADEAIVSLPAPVVSDSAPDSAVSHAVSYELQPSQGGWTLTLSVDRQWMESPDRVWPAAIDPSYKVPSPSLDCEIFSASPKTRQCGASGFKVLGARAVYHSSGSDEYARSLVKFDTSAIPAKAYVASAEVGLYSPSTAHNTAGAELLEISKKQWTNEVDWPEYKKSGKWTTEGGDFTSNGATVKTSERGSGAGWWNFSSSSLTSLVQEWVNVTLNVGLIVKLSDEKTHECSPSCTERLIEFDSSAAEESKRPYLSVVYYVPAPSTSKVVSPSEGTTSARRLKLKAAWTSAGVTGVTFQYREGKSGRFQTVASELVKKANGGSVSWPVATEGSFETEPLYFDAAHATSTLRNKGGPVQLRALFEGPTGVAGYSVPVNATINRFTGGPHDATAPVGPGTLDLLTGNLAVSHTDASVPGFESSLEFSRTFNSREAGSTGETTVLGQGWKPGIPAEEAGGSEWKNVRTVNTTEEFEGQKYTYTYAVVTDLKGNEMAFEKSGETYITPPELAGWKLSAEGTTKFVLTDPLEERTVFENNAEGTEYLPVSVSRLGGSNNTTQLFYDIVGSQRRLRMAIAPSANGVTCSEAFATTVTGCHVLTFTYVPASNWGAPSGYGERLSKITYYAPGNGGPWEVANYAYNSEGRLIEEWDPRISPALKETYSYELGGQIHTITPPGQEPWTFEYGAIDEELANGRLMSVKRPSLLEKPSVAQTTIAYGVPVSGSGAPYEMGGSEVGKWGQQDIPVDATAIFPPDEEPANPPTSYARATVYYMDAEGWGVNLATPSGAGTSSPSISTTETNEYGNVTRELSPQNRLRALAAGAESVTRSHELESKFHYSTDGTQLEEEWGPLHKVRLESGSTAEARLHRTIQYNDTEDGWSGTGVAPHLPTRETTGASIPGKGIDEDQRVTETHYNWSFRKPKETVVDPKGLNIRWVTAYETGTGLPIEVRQPSNPEGGGAGTTKTIYYTATTGTDQDCKNHPLYAGLVCKVLPATQPGTKGQPELLVKRIAAYNQLAEPTEIIESPGGKEEITRKIITTYDTVGRETKKEVSGGGTAVSPTQTVYSSTTGLPAEQKLTCEGKCEGFDSQATITGFDKLGRPVEYVDADGNVSTVTYDVDGRPVSTFDGKGTQTFGYDPTSGLLTKLEDSAVGTFTAAYDAEGDMTEKGLPDGLLAKTIFNEVGEPINHSYTKVTNCTEKCTWLEESEERSVYGQILSQTSLSSSQQYTYDHAGRLTLVKDTPAGGSCTTRSYNYDADSNRTSLVSYKPGEAGACSTSSESTTQKYDYDTADRLTGEGIEYDKDGNPIALTDPRGDKTTAAYDVMDRLESQTDPLKQTAKLSYDKAGELIETADRRGKVSKFSYDGLGRLASASFGVSGETAESTIGYEYNNANRLTKVNDSASGEYALSYDNLDRPTGVEGPNGAVGYEYDGAGRRKQMTVTGLGTIGYEYDNADRLTKISSGEQAVSLAYDKANRLEDITLPDGIEQAYGYDKAGEPTSIAYKKGKSILGEIDYAYDPNSQTEAMWGSYARLGLPKAMESAKYNAGNEMIEREGKELGYDANGNLISDGSNEYSWNARGQLAEISGASSAAFGYDPFGRRISKTLGGTTTDLLYDGSNVVQESVEGSVTANLLTGLEIDQLFSRSTKSGTDSYLTDRLGSEIGLASGSGEIETTYTYDPFGSTTEAGKASDNPYQFTGRENDGTGLQYNRARYYSPAMARFITQDPAGYRGSGSNLYWYTMNDPLDFTDPSGECAPWEPCIPNPLEAAKDAIHTLKHWVSGAPAVASEAAEGVESAEHAVGSTATDAWHETHKFLLCVGEMSFRVSTEGGPCPSAPEKRKGWHPEPEEPPSTPPPSGPPPLPSPPVPVP